MKANQMIHETKQFQDLVKDLEETSKYFPGVQKRVIGSYTFLSTIVRVEFEGKWYKIHCMEWLFQEEDTTLEGINIHYEIFFNNFILKVYQSLILSKVNLNIINLNGDPIFKLDELQIDEKERLLKIVTHTATRKETR